MNSLQIFKNKDFGEVRTQVVSGEPWFCLPDICKSLEIKNPTDVAKRLDDDEVARLNLGGLSGETNFVNESGLYSVILRSDKPNAKKFRKWVTSEVLPAIRKTGSYQKPLTEKEIMKIQLNMIEDIDTRVDKLENTMVIDYGQQRVLEKLVGATVITALGGKESNAYKGIGKKVFSECNRDIKDRFLVNSRNNIPKVKFDEACEYIQIWQPCTNTRILIKDTNSQMSIV